MMSRLGDIGGKLYRGEVSLNFVGRQRMWYMISGAILLISVVALLVRGLDFSVDFKGGAIFQFRAPAATLSQVQNSVADAGVDGALVQQTTQGSQAGWQVQTKALSGSQAVNVENSIASHLGINSSSITTNTVGASWGSQISTKAIEALIAFLIVVVLYLSIAFEWKMAVSAFVALLHDLVIATGVYALAGFQVSPATVIGLLTILGYSLYDTVVVFDKVRENTAGLLGGARSTYSQAANLALNQTLVRSINTSLIALLPVSAILVVSIAVLGKGNELEDLALVLFVGMLSGTYSSICIATPVLADLKEREPQYRALAKRVAMRAAGGRAAKRTAAKAQPAGVPAASASLAGGDADEAEDAAPPSDELTSTTASRMPTSSVRPGPRQQPRRTGGSARHRPAGKKKRR
jgi:preprotein translocase subunit SecF